VSKLSNQFLKKTYCQTFLNILQHRDRQGPYKIAKLKTFKRMHSKRNFSYKEVKNKSILSNLYQKLSSPCLRGRPSELLNKVCSIVTAESIKIKKMHCTENFSYREVLTF
jgi:hypothetical protein